MDQQDLLQQLQQNKNALLQLMRSPDGKRLIELLSGQNGSDQLKKAANAAAQGNTAAISAMVSHLMQSQEGAALVERINKSIGK